MKYNKYGNTNKQVSAIGFGGMRFDTNKSKEENAEIVSYAYQKGINYFDTAPDYCNDTSEDIMGLAFKKMNRNNFFVSTKGFPQKLSTSELSYEAVCKSLDRLNVDKIDFYHIWCIRHTNHYQDAIRNGAQYDGLLKAKEEGLIEHIVCSAHMQGDEITEILKDGKVEGILLGANILNFKYRASALEYAKEHGLGTVAMNPLGGGLIPKYVDKLQFLCDKNDKNAVEAAIRFGIEYQNIDVCLIGFSNRSHIDLACKIADTASFLSPIEIEKLSVLIEQKLDMVCTTCGYCKECPKEINIPNYMQFYNERVMFDKTDEEMKTQLKHDSTWGILVGPKSIAEECVACGKCETECTQHLPIIERLKQIAIWEKEIVG